MANTVDLLIKLFESNVEHILKCANAVDLKLNDSKTQIIPVNCTGMLDSFSDELYNKTGLERMLTDDEMEKAKVNHEKFKGSQKYKLIDSCEILSFAFHVMNKRLPKLHMVNVSESLNTLVGRLNKRNRYVVTSRKKFKSLKRRIELASSLIWSQLYDIGLIYPFVSETNFEKISTAIRSVVKNAGLDRFTSANDVYRMSLGISPKNIALKQLVMIGLKKIDPITVQNNRYLARITADCVNKPCLHKALTTFNAYKLDMRKTIIDNLVNQLNRGVEKLNYDAAKNTIKKYYSDELFTIDGVVLKGKIRKQFIYDLIGKNKYSRDKVRERIEKSMAAKNQVSSGDETDFFSAESQDQSTQDDSIDRFTLKHVRKR